MIGKTSKLENQILYLPNVDNNSYDDNNNNNNTYWTKIVDTQVRKY